MRARVDPLSVAAARANMQQKGALRAHLAVPVGLARLQHNVVWVDAPLVVAQMGNLHAVAQKHVFAAQHKVVNVVLCTLPAACNLGFNVALLVGCFAMQNTSR